MTCSTPGCTAPAAVTYHAAGDDIGRRYCAPHADLAARPTRDRDQRATHTTRAGSGRVARLTRKP